VDMREFVRELFETVLLALIIYLVLQFSVQPYRVEGHSMVPTFQEGEYLLVNKMVYWHVTEPAVTKALPFLDEQRDSPVWPGHPPHRGEVIIFRFPLDPSRNFVKRVIGEPGDVIEIRRGIVYLNGQELDEPYLQDRDEGFMRPVTVQTNSYFVLGDNRRASDDSRNWGLVPRDNIVGRSWLSYWPAHNLWELLH